MPFFLPSNTVMGIVKMAEATNSYHPVTHTKNPKPYQRLALSQLSPLHPGDDMQE